MSPAGPSPACSGCGRPGHLVLARRIVRFVGGDGLAPGQEAWYHRSHLPRGWRIVATAGRARRPDLSSTTETTFDD